MTAPVTIDRAMSDRLLLGSALGEPASSWAMWRTVLRGAFGLAPDGFADPHERAQWECVAANRKPPRRRVRELWCSIGRRGGKSRIAALIGVYIATCVPYRVAPGEVPMVLILAASTEQAKAVFAYAKAFLATSPILSQEIASVTAHEIRLRSGVIIAVHANSFRSTRGRTLLAVICDEISFWRDETTATPDIETYRAVLPSLATTRGILVAISSPYRRSGLLWQKFRDHHGQGGDDILCVKGATALFNPTLDAGEIEAQRLADPTGARSEWDAEFRTEITALLDDEVLDRAVDHDRPPELPPQNDCWYRAFVDVASGVGGGDHYTIAIGHRSQPSGVNGIDAIRGASGKFDPYQVTEAFAKLAREYKITGVTGDHYAAGWVSNAWERAGIAYARSEQTKSEIYLDAAVAFARGLVSLPANARLLRELRLLERTTHRGGRDSVDHARGGHDDYANVAAGCIRLLNDHLGYDLSGFADPVEVDPYAEQRDRRYRELLEKYGRPPRYVWTCPPEVIAAEQARAGIAHVPMTGPEIRKEFERWENQHPPS
jgi:hypothetical protein